MLPLLELQRAMRGALIAGGKDPALAAVVVGGGLSADERIAVHRNNVVASLTAVLADAFPVVARLGDSRFFAYAAHEFIAAYPPTRPCLAEYGAGFPDFLAGFPACLDVPYFADVARLEWLLHESARAPERPALGPAAMAGVAASDTPRLVLELQPTFGYLDSRFPVERIWRANQGCGEPVAVDLDAGPARVEVRRAGGTVEMRTLPAAEFALRTALKSGASLENAADTALAHDAQFDLMGALSRLFADGAVAALRLAQGAP